MITGSKSHATPVVAKSTTRTGRVALVTGGSKGIGFAIAEALAAYGVENLMLIARNPEDLATAKEQLQKEHPKTFVETLSADLSRPESYVTIQKRIKESYGKLDILVNNAGDFKQLPAVDASGHERKDPDELAQDVAAMFAVNSLPPVVFAHVLKELQLAASAPKQIDILSSAALEVFPNNTPYGPTKAAHERVSLGVVADSAGRITTVRIYPSNTDTRLVQKFSVPKVTPQTVANEAVRAALDGAATDVYIKMGQSGLVVATAKLDYAMYVKGESYDGLALVEEHRNLLAKHILPAVRSVKH